MMYDIELNEPKRKSESDCFSTPTSSILYHIIRVVRMTKAFFKNVSFKKYSTFVKKKKKIPRNKVVRNKCKLFEIPT